MNSLWLYNEAGRDLLAQHVAGVIRKEVSK